MAAVAARHVRHDEARQMQDRAQIDVDERVDILRRRIQDIAAPGLAGIVDQDVELGRLRQRRKCVEVADVDGAGAASGFRGQGA
jgi:hypothetical protein